MAGLWQNSREEIFERVITISQNEKQGITQIIDGVSFQLKEATDFTFLKAYGRVFCVFDQNDSGNISFGVEQVDGKKLFIKVAGAKSLNGILSEIETVTLLKRISEIYETLRHPSLIQYVDSGTYQELVYVVFKWQTGDCLFDHWNFDYYAAHPEMIQPRHRIKMLDSSEKQRIANQIIDFMVFVESKGYVAVDFYDASLLYDFEQKELTICDIDLFQKVPFYNQWGVDYWGSKRLKSPEEYQRGAEITAATNVFTLGALFFQLFGDYPKEQLKEMNEKSMFIPLIQEKIDLSQAQYQVLLTAVSRKPEDRYQTLIDFQKAWQTSLNKKGGIECV